MPYDLTTQNAEGRIRIGVKVSRTVQIKQYEPIRLEYEESIEIVNPQNIGLVLTDDERQSIREDMAKRQLREIKEMFAKVGR